MKKEGHIRVFAVLYSIMQYTLAKNGIQEKDYVPFFVLFILMMIVCCAGSE